MADPREVFDDALSHLDFLQSDDFEGQYFDRKEVRVETRNQINTLKESIRRCISAFANSNRAGGLLVLGIADDGTLTGTQHVDEQTMNGLLQALHDLDNHATEMQVVDAPVLEGKAITSLLHALDTRCHLRKRAQISRERGAGWERRVSRCGRFYAIGYNGIKG